MSKLQLSLALILIAVSCSSEAFGKKKQVHIRIHIPDFIQEVHHEKTIFEHFKKHKHDEKHYEHHHQHEEKSHGVDIASDSEEQFSYKSKGREEIHSDKGHEYHFGGEESSGFGEHSEELNSHGSHELIQHTGSMDSHGYGEQTDKGHKHPEHFGSHGQQEHIASHGGSEQIGNLEYSGSLASYSNSKGEYKSLGSSIVSVGHFDDGFGDHDSWKEIYSSGIHH